MLNYSHLLAAVTIGFSIATAQEKIDRDTVYHEAPVTTVAATQATERLSPVTFSNLSRSQIQQQYTVQDVPGTVIRTSVHHILF